MAAGLLAHGPDVPTAQLISADLDALLALREVYWLFDTDSEIRAHGTQAEGTVLSVKTETRVETNPECGDETTITEHFVGYRYDSPEGSHTARKKVGELCGMREGSKILVYYRTPTDRRVSVKDSAIDWMPQRHR